MIPGSNIDDHGALQEYATSARDLSYGNEIEQTFPSEDFVIYAEEDKYIPRTVSLGFLQKGR